MTKAEIIANSSTFKREYQKFVKSRQGLGGSISTKSVVLRVLYIIVSLVAIWTLYKFMVTGTTPGVFILPIILIVIVIGLIPSVFLFVSTLINIKIAKNITSFVRFQKNTDLVHGVVVHQKNRFITSLCYKGTISKDLMLQEKKLLTSMIKDSDITPAYDTIKLLVSESDTAFVGELVITDFYNKKVLKAKFDQFTFYQISFKTSLFRNRITTGIVDDVYYYPFVPTVWPTETSNSTRDKNLD